jgi:hypothetical protein
VCVGGERHKAGLKSNRATEKHCTLTLVEESTLKGATQTLHPMLVVPQSLVSGHCLAVPVPPLPPHTGPTAQGDPAPDPGSRSWGLALALAVRVHRRRYE